VRRNDAIFVPSGPVREAVRASGLPVRDIEARAGLRPNTLGAALKRTDMNVQILHPTLEILGLIPAEIGL
jgi:lambda repressor-like predicted transcriptional regulator